MSFPFKGPIAPFTNPNIEPLFFQPSQFFISNINLGTTTTVTTTLNLTCVVGQEVRFVIPPQFGCRQLNGQTGVILSLSAVNQAVVSVDSSQNVDAFVSSSAATQPQLLTIGDVNTGTINSTGITGLGTSVPGAFINTSPIRQS